MNILQILPELESGGVERGTIDLALALCARGHKAIVVSAGGTLVSRLERAGIKHYRLNVHKKSLFSILVCAVKLNRIIKREQIDIVHARSRVPAWIGFFAAGFNDAVFLTTCHGYYSRHFFSRVMGWGKLVIVISQIIGRHMLDDFRVPKEKIRLIYRGVDLKSFAYRGDPESSKNKSKKVIAIIGRITPLKGHVHFIKSLPGIFSEFPQASALIVGEAQENRRDYLQELKHLAGELGISGKVEFIGKSDDVPGLLKKIDLLVLATTTPEAFGRVIVEAGAVGVPVVATNVGGVTEILEHEQSGLLVEPESPHQIAAAAVRMFRDRDLAAKCVRNLKKKIEENFSLEAMVDNTIKVYEEALVKKRILVTKLGALGDVILIGPALKAIREKFPLCSLEVLVKKPYKDALQMSPHIDNLILMDGRGFWSLWKAFWRVRAREFDLSIDFQNNNFTHALCFLAGIKQRFGYNNKKLGFLLNKGIRDAAGRIDPVAHQFEILKTLGIALPPKNTLEFRVSLADKEYVRDYLKQNWLSANQILIGINAMASPRWKTKVWFAENYAAVADTLAKDFNARIVFLGTAEDAPAIEKIISLTSCKPINACGKTSVSQLAALIESCAALLCVDSAPMHIAAAVGTPFAALFGPTDPAKHLPYARKFALIRKDLACGPCYKPSCYRKNCMLEITNAEVIAAVSGLIRGGATGSSEKEGK